VEFMNRPGPYTGLSQSGQIPDLVQLSDIPVPSDSEVILGLGSRGPVVADLDSDAPHILVNAPTGKGKSTIARSVAVQRLCKGDVVVILDRKMHSHRWSYGLAPLVHYADTIPAIGQGLVNLGWELERRNRIVRDHVGPIETAPIGPRIIVLFEETNATLTSLRELDKQVAVGGHKALDAFQGVMFMGRAVKMHMVAFAQLASYRSGMTADLIENFGIKCMVGYSDKAWKWLAAEAGRFRPAPVETGRGMTIHGTQASETQFTYVDEASAREEVLASVTAQRRARELSGGARQLPEVWRTAIGR
jgi:hypothetical protein